MATREVTKTSDRQIALMQPEQQELLQAVVNSFLPGETLTPALLTTARVPAGGGRAWNIGDGAETTIEGVIILRQRTRAYWESTVASGATPDCSSKDGVVGIGDPGGICTRCPFAQPGSAVNERGEPGRGQRCKQITRLFVLTDGEVLPVFVQLPPTSGFPIQQYGLQLLSKGMGQLHDVVTELSLAQEKNPEGVTYSRVAPNMVRRLTAEERAAVESYRDGILPALQGMIVSGE